MANVDPTIALSAKAPDTMTGLGQMLNVARGAQAYQQQAESFPTLLEQQKLALNRSQQMLPIEVRQAEATAGTSELGLSQKQLTLAGGMLTGLEYSDALKTGNIPELTNQVKTIQHVLKSNGIPVEKTFGQVNSMLAAGDVKGVQNFIANLRTGLASAEQKYSAALPQPMAGLNAPATFTSGGPQGGTIQGAPINPTNAQQTQAPFTQVAPNVETAPVTAPPVVAAKPLTGVTPQQMSMSSEALAGSKSVPLPYPVRNPNQPYSPVMGEAEDTAKNIAYRQGLTNAQTSLTTSKRNIQEVLSSADRIEQSLKGETWITDWSTGGKGYIARKVNEFLGTDTGVELKQLNKDLANVAISNIKAQGGSLDTVNGQQLMKMANGDETYPPKILKDIARRTEADLTNIDMQATAADKFKNKFGDNNLNAFKQMWSANADSKIFEAKNIFDSDMSVEEKRAAIDKLLIGRVVPKGGKMTEAEQKKRNIFTNKFDNILKLVENGTL
jgi:hypothetical protein